MANKIDIQDYGIIEDLERKLWLLTDEELSEHAEILIIFGTMILRGLHTEAYIQEFLGGALRDRKGLKRGPTSEIKQA